MRGGLNKKYIFKYGDKYNSLTLLKEEYCKETRHTKWFCRCDCGTKKWIRPRAVATGATKSCGCMSTQESSAARVGGITHNMMHNWNRTSRYGSGVAALTRKALFELFKKQDGKCAITGVPISITDKIKLKGRFIRSASLDRIDPYKGYTIDNVQWVHIRVNIMRQDMTMEEFVQFCSLVLENNQHLLTKGASDDTIETVSKQTNGTCSPHKRNRKSPKG